MKLKLIVLFLLMSVFSYGQNATIKEEMLDMKPICFLTLTLCLKLAGYIPILDLMVIPTRVR